MFLRKKNAFVLLAESDAKEATLLEDGLDRLSVVEILNAIGQLPVGYRTVFNLHVIEGMAHRDIAILLGITEGTSRSQLSKSKSLLQKILQQKGMIYEQKKTK